MFSILILTKDEETNIAECIESVSWSNDVVVLDSFSSDRTVELSKAHGARVFQNRFENFALQRNFAHDQVQFKNPWVFHLDADERITSKLKEVCDQEVEKDEFSGYLIPNKLMFMGRWLRFSGMYPTFQFRLVKPSESRFIQRGHGQREGECKRGIGVISEPYLHFNFSKGIAEWIEKHDRYSTIEAREILKELEEGCLDWKGLFSFGDPVRRRRALKQLSFHLPFRSSLRFWYMYALRLGFLDGAAGLEYCRLVAMYELMTDLKVREFRLRSEGRLL